MLVILGLCGAVYFYRNDARLAKATLAARPKVEEKKSVREERGEVRTTRKFVDGKLAEEVKVVAPSVKTTELDKKSEPMVLKRADKIILGVGINPLNTKQKMGRVGFGFSDRFDILYGTDFNKLHMAEFNVRF